MKKISGLLLGIVFAVSCFVLPSFAISMVQDTYDTLEEYEAYLAEQDDLPPNFVRYEELAPFGEFESFVPVAQVFAVDEHKKYYYRLKDENNISYTITIYSYDYGDYPEENLPFEGELGEDLRTHPSGTDGYVVVGDAVYVYDAGILKRIVWFRNGLSFTLSVPSDYPAREKNTVVSKLLSQSASSDALEFFSPEVPLETRFSVVKGETAFRAYLEDSWQPEGFFLPEDFAALGTFECFWRITDSPADFSRYAYSFLDKEGLRWFVKVLPNEIPHNHEYCVAAPNSKDLYHIGYTFPSCYYSLGDYCYLFDNTGFRHILWIEGDIRFEIHCSSEYRNVKKYNDEPSPIFSPAKAESVLNSLARTGSHGKDSLDVPTDSSFESSISTVDVGQCDGVSLFLTIGIVTLLVVGGAVTAIFLLKRKKA